MNTITPYQPKAPRPVPPRPPAVESVQEQPRFRRLWKGAQVDQHAVVTYNATATTSRGTPSRQIDTYA